MSSDHFRSPPAKIMPLDHCQRPLIACIDDCQTVQLQVKGILEARGFEVLGITKPTQAFTTLICYRPALVLMDITMPLIDGYEVCRMLRRTSVFAKVPILMLTGKDGIVERIRAKGAGASDYLTKPFKAEELHRQVAKLLEVESVPRAKGVEFCPSSSRQSCLCPAEGIAPSAEMPHPTNQGASAPRSRFNGLICSM